MEIWELSDFTFHIYQVALLTLVTTPPHNKRQGLCLSQNPEAKPGTHMQSQAKFTCIGRPEHAWPTEYTELKSKYEMQTFDITLEEVSHHSRASVRIQANVSSLHDV